jgi:hypothetical protein
MHHSKIGKQMPQKCKSFSGSKNETADLYLQYGRTTEALALFRQIGDAQLIAHCLLIHAICLVHNISFWTKKAHSNST